MHPLVMLRRLLPYRMWRLFGVLVRFVLLSRRVMSVLVVGGLFRRLALFRRRRSCRCLTWVVLLLFSLILFSLACRLTRFVRWRRVRPNPLRLGLYGVSVMVVSRLVLRCRCWLIVVRRAWRRRSVFRVPCRSRVRVLVLVVVRVTRRLLRRRWRSIVARVVRLLWRCLGVRLLCLLILVRRCRSLTAPWVIWRLREERRRKG